MIDIDNYKPSHGAVVVTGATGDMGLAITERLYRAGQPVIIAACRQPERMRPYIHNLDVMYPQSPSLIIPARLDLSTSWQARRAATEIGAMGHDITGIINNAGVMHIDHTETSPDGFEMALQVNCISTLAFTLTLLPKLRQGAAVVMTSSLMRRFPLPRRDFATKAIYATNFAQRFNNYGRSKQILTWAATLLAERINYRGIRVNCADPGIVNTPMTRLGYGWVDTIADHIARPLMSTPMQGSRAALQALVTPCTSMMATQRILTPLPRLTSAQTEIATEALRLAIP